MTRDARAIVDLLREEIQRVGWSEVARRSGLRRENLHRVFKRGSGHLPSLSTISLVALAVGVRLEAHRG